MTFGRKWPQGRHMAQIEGPDLVATIKIFDLKVRRHPKIPKNFWKIFLNFIRMISYGP